MGIDKPKLKENSLINTTFYLFGSTFATILGEEKYFVIKSLNDTNRIYKLLYSGDVFGIHPYKLKRVLYPAQGGKLHLKITCFLATQKRPVKVFILKNLIILL